MSLLDYIYGQDKINELSKYLTRKVRFKIIPDKYKIKKTERGYEVKFLGNGSNTQFVKLAIKYRKDKNAFKKVLQEAEKIHPLAKDKICKMIDDGKDLLFIAKKFNVRLTYYRYIEAETKEESFKAIELVKEIKENLHNIDIKVLRKIMEFEEVKEIERGMF
ncbi:hypothetical protein C3L23_06150 [Nautilia sp. PV-1]|uniref:hypothetical protein n=1 Tax=Nautilia sp. PV-1 TaxID=2579250 RepID=UPI000FD8A75D|nr:hypothetical protein [Nautilia sp. PV-1]AZV46868.1 hypothetical protein C3L23_06150 [Nautilia sp. PV-1]